MDITVFAWIFIMVFFFVYTGIQTQRCIRMFQKLKAQRQNRRNATNNVTEVFTVEGNSRQRAASSNSTVDISVSATDRSFSFDRSANTIYLSRTLSAQSEDDSKKEEGLPSYEEAIANIRSNQMNNSTSTLSTMQLASQHSGTGASPSVVINIQTQVMPT